MSQITSPRHRVKAIASPIAGRFVMRFPPEVTHSGVNLNTFSLYNSSCVNLYKQASPYVTTSLPHRRQASSSKAWQRRACAGCIRHSRHLPATDHASQQARQPRTWCLRHQLASSRSRPCAQVAGPTCTTAQRYSRRLLPCGLRSRDSCVVSGLGSDLIHGCTA